MNLEPLEVFALTSDMQRATGSIPYTSLMWNRKYYEAGDFLMEVPANVYDPSWAYIYTDERPETGIIQKVEYSDTATTAGGVDTVILSGFFMEWELNRYTFLGEQTEEEAYRYYKPSPARKSPPKLYQGNDGNLYQEAYGGGLYDMSGEYVAPVTSDKYESLGLTEVELGLGAGATEIMFETNNLDKFPSGYWGSGEYTRSGYAYYTDDGKTIRVVDSDGDSDAEGEYEMVGFGPGTSSQAIYKDSDGSYKWVTGVTTKIDGAYERALDSWQNEVKSEGLEVVVGDGTIMGGSTYAIKHRTVKGPWQLRTDLDVNEPADNVQRIIQWAQDIWGNNILYDEPGFAGESKIIDPSMRLFGDLAYEELKTVGASPRMFYSFESDTCVFEVWRGLDRTQSQAGVPAPPTPDEPEPDEPTIDDLYEAVDYIEATGEQWIDTGVIGKSGLSAEMSVTWPDSSGDEGVLGSRTGSTRYYMFHNYNGVMAYAYGSFISNTNAVESGKTYNVTSNLSAGSQTVSVNGSAVVSATASASYDTGLPMYLFALNVDGTAKNTCKIRLGFCQIYDNGTLVRDFVPRRRISDGAVGLLDLVNDTFYESAGSEPFLAPDGASSASAYALARTTTEEDSNTAANPFAVFSDTWGTLYGFTASRDVSNYRNTCYVLYQFRDQTDADGNPIGPRGFVKARLEDELPDAETYLDLRGEEPEEGQTDEAFIESLRQRGLTHLQANYAAIESLDTGTLTGNGYLKDYDLGDKADMLVEAIGLVKEARITGVCEVHEAGSSTATLEIGEQKLTNIRKAVIV